MEFLVIVYTGSETCVHLFECPRNSFWCQSFGRRNTKYWQAIWYVLILKESLYWRCNGTINDTR